MNPNTNDPKVTEQAERIWAEHHHDAARAIAGKARIPMTDPRVQDAVTDATIRLLQTLHRGRLLDVDDAGGWFTTVAWREFLRARDRDARHPDTDHDVDTALADLGPTALETLTRNDVDPVLERALARLSPVQRSVIHGIANGDTYDDLEQRLHLSHTAISKALHRARRRLRQDATLTRELARLGG